MNEYEMYAAVLKKGGVLGYPADTVWGLAADATNKEAYDHLYTLKQRERNKPISVLMRDMAMVEQYAEITDAMRCFMNHLLPGPFTVIVPSALYGRGVGIRILARDTEKNIFRYFINPIALTSANTSGKGPATTREDMAMWEQQGVVIMNQEDRMSGTASVVVSLTGNTATIFRGGKREAYIRNAAEACGISVDERSD